MDPLRHSSRARAARTSASKKRKKSDACTEAAQSVLKGEPPPTGLPIEGEGADSAALASEAAKSVRTASPALSEQSDEALECAQMGRTEGGGVFSTLTKWLSRSFARLLNFVIEPGFIQRRAYMQTMEPLIDVQLGEKERLLPLTQKVKLVQDQTHNSRLAKAYGCIAQMCERGADGYALRKAFFHEISTLYRSEEYQSYLQGGEKTPFVTALQGVGRTLFTEVHLHSFAESATRAAMEKGGRGAVGEQTPLSQILQEDRDAIEKAPGDLKGDSYFATANKLKGHLNIDFQPLHENNPISNLFSARYRVGESSFESTCLRFGTPTVESADRGSVEIAPIFHLFLDGCKESGEKVVSFQHQNAAEKSFLKGNESPRLRAMIDLGQSERYKDVLYVVALPMDGDFFKQKGEFAEDLSVEAFKKAFKEELKGAESLQRFSFPDGYALEKCESDLNAIIDRVGELYFDREKPLTQGERQIFQMLTYTHFEEYFLAHIQPKFYHSQCKDAMDRAMSLNVVKFYVDQLRMGSAGEMQTVEDVRTLTHFAPLLIKGIGMHGGRFKILKATLDHLQKLPDSKKEALRTSSIVHVQGGAVGVEEIRFNRLPNKQVALLPADAQTKEDFLARCASEGAQCYVQEGIESEEQAQKLMREILIQRYNAPAAQIAFSKPVADGTQYTATSDVGSITCTLELENGRLELNWQFAQ